LGTSLIAEVNGLEKLINEKEIIKLTSGPKTFSTSLRIREFLDDRSIRVPECGRMLFQLFLMLTRDFYPKRFHGDLEIGIQTIENGERGDDPSPVTINVAALNSSEGLEHIDMPLTKFVNPRWEKLRATSKIDDVVKPLLEKCNEKKRWKLVKDENKDV